jgi:hypothetical protein
VAVAGAVAALPFAARALWKLRARAGRLVTTVLGVYLMAWFLAWSYRNELLESTVRPFYDAWCRVHGTPESRNLVLFDSLPPLFGAHSCLATTAALCVALPPTGRAVWAALSPATSRLRVPLVSYWIPAWVVCLSVAWLSRLVGTFCVHLYRLQIPADRRLSFSEFFSVVLDYVPLVSLFALLCSVLSLSLLIAVITRQSSLAAPPSP